MKKYTPVGHTVRSGTSQKAAALPIQVQPTNKGNLSARRSTALVLSKLTASQSPTIRRISPRDGGSCTAATTSKRGWNQAMQSARRTPTPPNAGGRSSPTTEGLFGAIHQLRQTLASANDRLKKESPSREASRGTNIATSSICASPYSPQEAQHTFGAHSPPQQGRERLFRALTSRTPSPTIDHSPRATTTPAFRSTSARHASTSHLSSPSIALIPAGLSSNQDMGGRIGRLRSLRTSMGFALDAVYSRRSPTGVGQGHTDAWISEFDTELSQLAVLNERLLQLSERSGWSRIISERADEWSFLLEEHRLLEAEAPQQQGAGTKRIGNSAENKRVAKKLAMKQEELDLKERHLREREKALCEREASLRRSASPTSKDSGNRHSPDSGDGEDPSDGLVAPTHLRELEDELAVMAHELLAHRQDIDAKDAELIRREMDIESQASLIRQATPVTSPRGPRPASMISSGTQTHAIDGLDVHCAKLEEALTSAYQENKLLLAKLEPTTQSHLEVDSPPRLAPSPSKSMESQLRAVVEEMSTQLHDALTALDSAKATSDQMHCEESKLRTELRSQLVRSAAHKDTLQRVRDLLLSVLESGAAPTEPHSHIINGRERTHPD